MPGMRDFDRPLNERGMSDAAAMARRFAERHVPVDLLVSSPAVRAITTASIFRDALGPVPLELRDALYLAGPATLFNLLAALPPQVHSAMVFGHNPGLSELVATLADGRIGELPTCTAVHIDIHLDHWDQLAPGTGTIGWWESPPRGL